MSTSTTPTTSSAVRFIVAVQNAHGGWNKVGFVTLNKRCVADEALCSFFPKGTRGHEDVLKACRWVAGEKGARSVDFQVRSMMVKVHTL